MRSGRPPFAPAAAILLAALPGLVACRKPPMATQCPPAPGPPLASSASASPPGAPVDFCAACGHPGVCGNVTRSDISEASGIVESALHPGTFYIHNDSGDEPRFFAVDATGADRGVYNVASAEARDWEDIAVGPCPAGSCVYLADIGDNGQSRKGYTIYRVPEPEAVGPGGHPVRGDALRFVYPDGSHNAETLLVHPTTGLITIVTKTKADDGTSAIYEFPPGAPSTSDVSTLVRKGPIAPPRGNHRFTGGDVHPAGRGVLLRTYTDLFFYPMQPGETVAAALLKAPCPLPVADEPQGEAVGWLRSGDGYVTTSEGSKPSLSFVMCAGK